MGEEGFVIRSTRVLTPTGLWDGAVVVRGEKIAAVVAPGALPAGLPVLDVGKKVVTPGVVDCHAHINEPGRTEWEGFETATRAAAAGGITTVVDMPLNSIPPTTTVEGLRAKARAAEGRCAIDYGFWGGVVPKNLLELDGLADEGVTGFKCFLIESGVEEFPHVQREHLQRAMPLLAHRRLPLIVHAELEHAKAPASTDPRRYAGYLASRPKSWENEAVRMMVELCRATRCAVHIVHLSSADALADLAAARSEGLPVTAETCPHYLTFAAEEIADGATHFKCAPPIREAENRERLWRGLTEGRIDLVVSDHSPCTPALKKLEEGAFPDAWGGISSLQLSLSAVWTGMRQRGLELSKLARWMCEAPAWLAGLSQKGAIAPGRDADLVVFDPEAGFAVEPAMIQHRHRLTPYEGRLLFGRVETTFLRGRKIFERGHLIGRPSGRRLRRPLRMRGSDAHP
ncbi:MAG: allantoinase AllB [Myxococcota bacterium]